MTPTLKPPHRVRVHESAEPAPLRAILCGVGEEGFRGGEFDCRDEECRAFQISSSLIGQFPLFLTLVFESREKASYSGVFSKVVHHLNSFPFTYRAHTEAFSQPEARP